MSEAEMSEAEMSEAEDDRREELLPFPEVYIKEEPREAETEIDNLEEDSEGGMGLEEDYGERLDVGNNPEEMADEDYVGLQDKEDSKEEDSAPAVTDLLQDGMKCGVCQREFSSAASLKAHLSKKHKLAMGPCFTCHLCGAIGQTRATLKRHLLRTHGQSSLEEHQMLKKCQHCGEGYVTQLALNTHIAEAHAELLSEYQKCPQCPGRFRGRQGLLRHISRKHPDVNPRCLDQEQCQECQLTFPSRIALRLHQKDHHPEALIHRCQSCSATFKYSYMLRRHVKSIHEKQKQQKEQLYKCCECPREYRCKAHLEKHLTIAHIAPKKPRLYQCTKCSATFPTRSTRSRHTRRVHWDRSRPRCSECNHSFDSIEKLNVHRQIHKMKCAVCDKTFLRRDSLREHILIHSGPRLPCPYCPKKFTQNSNLKRHIRIHTGEKPYKCSFCTKRFGDKSACNSHMRVHTGAERCSCPECGASFSKRQKLNYHMRKHTGEGLLPCPLCTRPATNSYSLKKHLETHQTVLCNLLQGARVLEQAEDCQRLAIRTLHNLAWVTVRGRASDRAASLRPPRVTSPAVEDKEDGYEGETQQMLPSDCEEKKPDAEDNEDVRTAIDNEDVRTAIDNEDVRTAIEHIEVVVKVESPEELDEPEELHEPEHSLSETEGNRSSLRQFRKVNRKINILTDPLEDKDLQHNEITQKCDDVKTEVLSYIVNLRCAQFNEAVEKCKFETAIKEENLHNQIENNSWKNNEGKTDEVEGFPVLKELEATRSDLNKSMINTEEDIDIKSSAVDNNTLSVAWEEAAINYFNKSLTNTEEDRDIKTPADDNSTLNVAREEATRSDLNISMTDAEEDRNLKTLADDNTLNVAWEEFTRNNLNKIMTNTEGDIDAKTPAEDNALNITWEKMKECSYSLMEEPLVALAQLWQHIIEPKEERIPQFSRCLLKEDDLQVEADKDTSGSVVDLREQSEPEQQEICEVVMDSEVSECED